MHIPTAQLIGELAAILGEAKNAAIAFKNYDLGQLNYKAGADKWSILQCLDHLNHYGDFYIPEIQKQIENTPYKQGREQFKSGIIGNYFVEVTKVKNGKISKMKSPENMKPSASELTFTTIDRFIKQLELLEALLFRSQNIDLTNTKTSISLTRLIKLRLGDTLRFMAYHIERHILQAKGIVLPAN